MMSVRYNVFPPKIVVSASIILLGLATALSAQVGNTYITGGTITQDSTWTKEGSPYVISGDVRINDGATLTIEPGVRVLFERYDENNIWHFGQVDIIVDGTLKAIGSESDSIYFDDINGQETWNTWGSIMLGGNADIKYAVFKHAVNYALYLHGADSVAVTNSLFASCGQGIHLEQQNSTDTYDNIKVEYNTFIDNHTSIVYVVYFGACLIQYNDFYSSYSNDIQVEWWWHSAGNFSAYYNNFHNNNNNNIISNSTYDPVDMRYNYWGPAATAEMNAGGNPKDISRIDDYYNDNNRGKVDYAHWLDAPWPNGQAVGATYSADLLITDNQYQAEALTYHSGDNAFIQVADPDRNTAPIIPDQIILEAWSELETTHETITLSETANNSGIFRGNIPLDDASGVPSADGKLQVNHGDWMYFRYIDPADDWGQVDTMLDGRVYDLTVSPGGQIDSAETWTVAGGPYLLTGDIIHSGALTIEPGVTVYFEPHRDDNGWGWNADLSEIWVTGGTLTAVGTVTDSITFQSYNRNPKPGQWGGFGFLVDSAPSSIIQYARIEGCDGNGAVTIENGSPQILNTLIRNNTMGINIWSGSNSTPLIKNCTITQSTTHGILTMSHAVIEDNDIYDNYSDGIVIHNYGGSESIKYNNIYNNRGSGISFHWGSSSGTVEIIGNNIHDNSTNGVGVYSNHLIRLRDNNVYANNGFEIYHNRNTQIDARFNYWGPTATSEMSAGGNPKNIATIYDYFDDPNLGVVDYARWLDIPWPSGTPVPGGYSGELNFIYSDGTNALGYREGDSLFIQLYDPDLNLDTNTPEVAQVGVWSQLETTPELLYLTEVAADTGLFTGWMKLDGATGYPMTDGVLQVDMNNWIYTSCNDALDNWNNSATVQDSARYSLRIKEHMPDENTVLLLHFNEGSGQAVDDASQFSNHGYFGSSQAEDGNDPQWYPQGISGNCIYFPGSRNGIWSYITIPPASSLGITGTGFTIEMWVNFQSASYSNDWFLGRIDANQRYNLGLHLDPENSITGLLAINNQEVEQRLSPHGAIHLNRWYHIAMTYDGFAMRLYIDGDSVGIYQIPGDLTPAGAYNLFLGSNGHTDQNANMYMDEVRISNIARTSFDYIGEGLPPGKVADLAVTNSTSNSIILQWHAPGADGYTGTVVRYDLRRSTSPIDSANFTLADSLTGLPDPETAGALQSLTVTGLNYGTTYYFALKAVDDEGLWSPMSNVAQATTEPLDETAPGTITDLAVAEAGKRYVVLTWTAPADDGQAGRPVQGYFVHYSTTLITEQNFSAADSTTPPVPVAPGTTQTDTITGLDPNTTYYFAVKAYDEVPNWSAISNPSQTTTLAVPVLAASAWPSYHGGSRNSGFTANIGASVDSLYWSYTTGGQIASSPTLDVEGNIYVGSEDGFLYTLDVDGNLRWKKSLGGEIFASPLIATDGHLYVGSKSGTFYCLATATGNTIWTFATGDQIYSSPVISDQGRVYFGSLNGKLYALQSDDGEQVWSFTADSKIYNSPALAADGSVVYFGSQAGTFYAIDARLGTKQWEYAAGSAIYSSPAVDTDSAGSVYFAALNGHVYSFNSAGSKNWEFDTTGISIFYSSPALDYNLEISPAANRVYIGTDNGELFCLDAAMGTVVWSYLTEGAGAVRNAPAVAGNGLIYFGSADNTLYCLDRDGTPQWSHATGGELYISSPSIALTGRIYVGSYDGKIYSLGHTNIFMILLRNLILEEYSGNIDISYRIYTPAGSAVILGCMYSTDEGETWSAASVTGDTTNITPEAYAGTIIWNSENDLAGMDLTSVQFKIEPYDQDSSGIAAITSLFHLDNNHEPVSTITPITIEQSGDVTIQYTLQDDEQDTLSFVAQYSEDRGITWQAAAIIGTGAGLVPATYTGSLVWYTLTDLPGWDDSLTYFRIIPSDYEPGTAGEVVFHVDNNEPPSLTLSQLPNNTIISQATIPFMLTDPESDTLTITTEVSFDQGQSWVPSGVGTEYSAIAPADYSGVFSWLAFASVYGERQDVQIRAIPYDYDPGQGDTLTGLTVIYHIGDYTGDQIIDPQDLAQFAAAWNATPQNTAYEIGPATGTVPDLIPQPDGIIEFEDLTVFAMMWNWSFANNGFAKSSSLLAKATSGSTSLSLVQRIPANLWAKGATDLITVDVYLDRDDPTMMVDGVLSFDPLMVKYVGIKEGGYLKQYYESTPMFAQVSPDSSQVLFAVVGLGIQGEVKETDLPVATVQFRPVTKTTQDLSLTYALRDESGAKVEQNLALVELESLLPEQFVLHQNFPNPFNPNTSLRYELPIATNVVLVVYDILGREVIRLVDEHNEAGYHQVIWQGQDRFGRGLASGVYIYRLVTSQYTRSRKMLLLK